MKKCRKKNINIPCWRDNEAKAQTQEKVGIRSQQHRRINQNQVIMSSGRVCNIL